jgi:hypothetical protein
VAKWGSVGQFAIVISIGNGTCTKEKKKGCPMKNCHVKSTFNASVCVLLTLASLLNAQTPSTSAPEPGTRATTHAIGPFDVKITPQDDKSRDADLGRMLIDKEYHGDLEGTGKGQMLTAGSVAKGSGAYVAIERVSGTLKGREGSFTLQHSGTMNKGATQLVITIVPDSGTGQLAGIAGEMTINIAAGGKHSYELKYTLPKAD